MSEVVKYTPGPWDASGLTVYDTCKDGVASCHSRYDAIFIAAAPDLFEAAKELIDVHNDGSRYQERALAFLKLGNAIAKAEGR